MAARLQVVSFPEGKSAMKHKRIGVLAAVLSAGLVVGACSSAPTTASSGGHITLTVSTWDTGNGLIAYRQGIKAFEASHPDISVSLESINSTYYEAKILTALSNGTAPDLILVGDDEAPEMVASGALVNLTPLVTSHAYGIDQSAFFPSVWASGVMGGKDYFIPKDWADEAVIYNKALFAKAGVPLPKAGWTLAQFEQDAKKLTVTKNGRTSQWGVQLPGDWLRAGVEYIATAYGSRVISPNGHSVSGYLDSPEATAALDDYFNMYKEGISPSPAAVTGFGNIDLFATGRVAMIWNGPWNVGEYEEDKSLDFGVAPMPIGPSGQQVTEQFWSGFAVNAHSQHVTQAEELAGFFASKQWANIDGYWAMPALDSPSVVQPIEKRNPAMTLFFQLAKYDQPIQEEETTNWVKDVQNSLVPFVDAYVVSPGNLPAKLKQVVQQIDTNLSSTYSG
jgi:multiple sugar transport system substrate-binding protein